MGAGSGDRSLFLDRMVDSDTGERPRFFKGSTTSECGERARFLDGTLALESGERIRFLNLRLRLDFECGIWVCSSGKPSDRSSSGILSDEGEDEVNRSRAGSYMMYVWLKQLSSGHG